MKNCVNCGRDIPADSSFCLYCGANQRQVECEEKEIFAKEEIVTCSPKNESDTNPTKSAVKAKKGAWIASIIRNSVIMAVAIVLLVGSFFPMSSTRLEDAPIMSEELLGAQNADVSLGLNVFQYITLFFDSFSNDTEYIYELWEEAEEIENTFEDYDRSDFASLSPEEKSLLNDLYFILARISAKRYGFSISIVFSIVFGIANILLGIALVVLALLNLLSTFNIIKSRKAGIYKWTLGLLTASPALILAAHYAGNLYTGSALSTMAIWSIISSALAVVLTTVLRYIFANRDTLRNIIARSIALVLSVVVFCLAFAPLFNVRFKTYYSKRATVSHGVEFLNDIAINENEEEWLDEYFVDMTKSEKREYFEERMDEFSNMTKREIEGEIGTTLNTSILTTLLGAKIGSSGTNLLSATMIFFVLTVASALLILWQSLYFFATGKHAGRLVFITKICTAILSALALVSTIVLIAIVDSYAYDYIVGSNYRVSISAGVIIFVIFAIGSIFCPTSLVKKQRKEKAAKNNQDSKPSECEVYF